MSLKSRLALFLVSGVLISRTINASANKLNSHPSGNNSNHEDPPPLKVAKFDFERVSGPLIIIVWILIASLAKLGTLKSFMRAVLLLCLISSSTQLFYVLINVYSLCF